MYALHVRYNADVSLQLPPLPQEASVMNPGQYCDAPAAEPPITFSFMHKKSLFESIFSRTPAPAQPSTTATAAAPPAPSAASGSSSEVPFGRVVTIDSATVGSTGAGESPDEVVARELQRQFDEEAAMLASTSPAGAAGPPYAPPNAGNSLV